MHNLTNLKQLDNEINVLIVEDEIVLAMALELSLSQMGFMVSGIESNTKRAISHARNNIPDIILMDINLASSSGITAANEIWKTLKIPIIFLTSYSNDKTIKEAMECEPYGYLLKPCRDKELKITINMAIHKHNFFFKNKNSYKIIESKYIHIDENIKFDISKSELYKDNKQIKLTKNEKKLFEIMCERPGKIVNFERISTYIWRESIYDKGRLRTLIYRLKIKLGTNIFENLYELGYKIKVVNFE
ncbi:response regulator [Poseidonibacter antarcticus]|uniref:response regulator n=1 Tax=Poseidonibacter antarcticus TaxID=2478538 RepID=UPI001D18D5BC|nr:response regulator [Poseidonibacter antarcticus]